MEPLYSRHFGTHSFPRVIWLLEMCPLYGWRVYFHCTYVRTYIPALPFFDITHDIVIMSIVLEVEEDKECDAAVCIIEESDHHNPTWVGCECGLWFHMYCLDLDSFDENFVCTNCQVDSFC